MEAPHPETPENGISLEAAMERLEQIVRQIQEEELELDASLALFEEGVGLLRAAERILESAELRIEQMFGDEEEGVRMRTITDEL